MKTLRYLLFVVLLLLVNAIPWAWCKLTGKRFTMIGGEK